VGNLVRLDRRPSRLATLVAGLVAATLTIGAIYKWTDKEGKVHYSDTPPPGEHQVVTVAPGPTPEQQEQSRQRAQAIAESLQRERAAPPGAATSSQPREATTLDPTHAVRACANAMVQRLTLDLQTPVYRRSGPGDFQYLADADRPAEKARLEEDISKWCSDDPAQSAAVRQRFLELSLGRRPRCIELRDELQDRVLRGETSASEGVQLAVARLRQFNCGDDVPIDGVWLAKWDYQLQPRPPR
jgi:broad specificity phosphatase PhoE